MPRFLVTRVPGPAWDPAKPTREQPGWDPHAAFMDLLAEERFVAFGGPAGTENEVVVVIDAADQTTIRARLALDPWTSPGVLDTAVIEPWTIWLGGDERIDVTPGRQLFLVRYGPGPAWEPTKPRRGQAGWDAHASFMDTLTAQGVVLLGGPLDEHRALLVMRHGDEGGLRAQLASDPWVDSVLKIDSIERWRLWLRRPAPADARQPRREP
jgi:uncharacterized protein YciI